MQKWTEPVGTPLPISAGMFQAHPEVCLIFTEIKYCPIEKIQLSVSTNWPKCPWYITRAENTDLGTKVSQQTLHYVEVLDMISYKLCSGKSKAVHCILHYFKPFNSLVRLLTHFNEIIQVNHLLYWVVYE